MGAGAERWLLTYSDMITLLLALFVILFAMSNISQKKLDAVHQSIISGFSHFFATKSSGPGLLDQTSLVNHPGTSNTIYHPLTSTPLHPITSSSTLASASTPPQAVPPTSSALPGQLPLSTIYSQIGQALQAKGLAAASQLVMETRGVVVRIYTDNAFYASDVATLSTVGDEVVDTIASVLKSDRNDVVVEGYTDSQPIVGGPYSSNWELGAMRAVNVVQRFIHVDGINENRLAAVSYGKTRPVVPNTTPQNMAENRRVDVVVLAPGQDRL